MWFQPLNRLVVCRVKGISEIASDDWAVNHGVGRLLLARCLTAVAGWTDTIEPVPNAVAATGAPNGRPTLTDRVERLVAGDQAPDVRQWGLSSLVLLVLVTFGSFHLLPRAAWAEDDPAYIVPMSDPFVQQPESARVSAKVTRSVTGALEADLLAVVNDLERVDELLAGYQEPELQTLAESLQRRLARLKEAVALADKQQLNNKGAK